MRQIKEYLLSPVERFFRDGEKFLREKVKNSLLMKMMMKNILMVFLVMGGFFLIAISCDKKGGGYSLKIESEHDYVKISEDGEEIIINADELSKKILPVFSDEDKERKFGKVLSENKGIRPLFTLTYSEDRERGFPKTSIFFIVPGDTGKNPPKDLIFRQAKDTLLNSCTIGSESKENALAHSKEGGICRFVDDYHFSFWNYLGTVFPAKKEQGRGMMMCLSVLGDISITSHINEDGRGSVRETLSFGKKLSDTLTFREPKKTRCYLGIINELNSSTAMGKTKYKNYEDFYKNLYQTDLTLSSKWIDSGNSGVSDYFTAYAIVIEGKKFPHFFGGTFEEFSKEISNEKLQEMMVRNNYHHLRFRLKLVKPQDF